MNETLAEVLSRHPVANTVLGFTSSLTAFVLPALETVDGWLRIVGACGGLVLLGYSILAARLRYHRERAITDERDALARIAANHKSDG